MNKAIMIGFIASDPEAYTTQGGVNRSTFRMAVQRKYSNAQGVKESDFFTVVAWRQTADFCNRFLGKGRKVAVEGSIQTRTYDAQDGSKRNVVEIIADSVEALDKGDRNERPAEAPNVAPKFEEVEDDQLPWEK